jgi:hypothetical protein
MRLNNTAASREAMIDDRRARVASYKVQGLSIRKIVAALAKDKCVNPDSGRPWNTATIQSDLVHLTEVWKASALRDITQVKADELAKLDELEREAWQAWRRGIGRKQIRTTKTGGVDGGSVSLKTETLNGDPRFLALVLDCQQRRAKMLGLDEPTPFALAGPGGGPIPVGATVDLKTLSADELAALAAILSKAEGHS